MRIAIALATSLLSTLTWADETNATATTVSSRTKTPATRGVSNGTYSISATVTSDVSPPSPTTITNTTQLNLYAYTTNVNNSTLTTYPLTLLETPSGTDGPTWILTSKDASIDYSETTFWLRGNSWNNWLVFANYSGSKNSCPSNSWSIGVPPQTPPIGSASFLDITSPASFSSDTDRGWIDFSSANDIGHLGSQGQPTSTLWCSLQPGGSSTQHVLKWGQSNLTDTPAGCTVVALGQSYAGASTKWLGPWESECDEHS